MRGMDKEIATDNIKDGIITRWDMTITPEDFKAVLHLVKPLYQHATHILSGTVGTLLPALPNTRTRVRARKYLYRQD